MAGRKPLDGWEPTDRERRMIVVMREIGKTHDEIAEILAIDRNTLVKHFGDELEVGKGRATMEVATTFYEKAISPDLTGPSVSAGMFWLRTVGGWRLADAGDEARLNDFRRPAIQQNNFVQIDVTGLPSDELRAIASLARRIESAGGEGGS